jgi:hypothetical protein
MLHLCRLPQPHFPVTNGKLFATYTGQPPCPDWSRVTAAERQDLVAQIGIGLHVGCHAHFVRARNPAGCLRVQPAPIIDQVYVAAFNLRATGVKHVPKHHIADKMDFLLEGAYRGTYSAAVARGTRHLVLTSVGGGVFYNPLPNVARAMAAAHAQWAPLAPLLTTVVLPLFTLNADPSPFIDALATVGVPVVLVHHAWNKQSRTNVATRVAVPLKAAER